MRGPFFVAQRQAEEINHMEVSIGRVVHVRAEKDGIGGKCQPATVVRVWSPTTINAVVLRDGGNDTRYDGGRDDLTRWATSIVEGSGNNQYHDPRECPFTEGA